MCACKYPLLCVSFAALVIAAGQALPGSASAAQPEKKAIQPDKKPTGQPGKDAKPSEAEMAAMMAMMQPGPEHKILEGMTGTWEGTVKIWMAPGEEPKTSKGSAKREMSLDGHYLVEHIDAEPIMEMPGGIKRFKGMGITGYNNMEKKYESVWIDNSSTGMMFATGKYDAVKKTFTFEGDSPDPATGKKSHHRDIMDISNPEKHTSVSYATGPDGKEFKCFEGTFERKSK